uniref:Uncharacterized protein n=1 Tax=Prymnesium polylepis TaxID=72548 RepID=A0A7S4J5B2_9EUKA|mmetsp:Transcript_67064/g.183945  ORF Transcript_67064/g.183945 Transcript_67064/m.183945 type:complete len:110 (+) Transcript_67064:312-641(+)
MLQLETDPLSNCLTPRLGDDPTRAWAGTTCSLPVPPPGCAGDVGLAYGFNSECVQVSHSTPAYLQLPANVTVVACSDLCEANVAVCPLLPPPPAPSVMPYTDMCAVGEA